MISVQAHDFNQQIEYERLKTQASIGAIVTFTGLVRDINQGQSVSDLSLEHYPHLLYSEKQKIGKQILAAETDNYQLQSETNEQLTLAKQAEIEYWQNKGTVEKQTFIDELTVKQQSKKFPQQRPACGTVQCQGHFQWYHWTTGGCPVVIVAIPLPLVVVSSGRQSYTTSSGSGVHVIAAPSRGPLSFPLNPHAFPCDADEWTAITVQWSPFL